MCFVRRRGFAAQCSLMPTLKCGIRDRDLLRFRPRRPKAVNGRHAATYNLCLGIHCRFFNPPTQLLPFASSRYSYTHVYWSTAMAEEAYTCILVNTVLWNKIKSVDIGRYRCNARTVSTMFPVCACCFLPVWQTVKRLVTSLNFTKTEDLCAHPCPPMVKAFVGGLSYISLHNIACSSEYIHNSR